jgi:hypothetical protein
MIVSAWKSPSLVIITLYLSEKHCAKDEDEIKDENERLKRSRDGP